MLASLLFMNAIMAALGACYLRVVIREESGVDGSDLSKVKNQMSRKTMFLDRVKTAVAEA